MNSPSCGEGKEERGLPKRGFNSAQQASSSMITGTFQKITRKPQKLFTAIKSGNQTEVLYQTYGRVIRICD